MIHRGSSLAVLSAFSLFAGCDARVDVVLEPRSDATVDVSDSEAAPSSLGCSADVQPCRVATDCCSGKCSSRGCTPLTACVTHDGTTCSQAIGGTCATADDCCSGSCGAAHRCVAPGGCLPECEVCAVDTDCCSHVCRDLGEGVLRCHAGTTCVAEGERCTAAANCCPAGSTGLCAFDPASMRTRCHSPSGGGCRADSSGCALGSECCGGRCVPRPDGILACTTACITDGGACTIRDDCCSATADCVRVDGRLRCAAAAR